MTGWGRKTEDAPWRGWAEGTGDPPWRVKEGETEPTMEGAGQGVQGTLGGSGQEEHRILCEGVGQGRERAFPEEGNRRQTGDGGKGRRYV